MLRAVTACLCAFAMFFSTGGAFAMAPGIVVASSGGKDTLAFQQWQDFRRRVDEKSNGGVLLDYLIFGELGTPQSMFDAVTTGRASIGGFGCAGVTQSIPELAIPQMPFLFDSEAEADFVLERYLTPIFTEILGKRGLVLLAWTDYGFMDLYSREPVTVPAQLQGKQIRTLSNVSGPAFLQAVKATPVDVGISEIATTSQAEKLFGGVGMLQGYGRLQQSFHYYTSTRHAFNCGVVVANKAWFESGTPQEQDLIRAAYTPLRESSAQTRVQEKSLEAKFQDMGTTFLKLSPEQHNAWAAAGLPLYPQIMQKAGGRSIEIYDQIRAGKQAYLRNPVAPDHH